MLRGLLCLFMSGCGLLALRLFSSTFAEEWLPTAAVLVALGLITVALIEVVRARETLAFHPFMLHCLDPRFTSYG